MTDLFKALLKNRDLKNLQNRARKQDSTKLIEIDIGPDEYTKEIGIMVVSIDPFFGGSA